MLVSVLHPLSSLQFRGFLQVLGLLLDAFRGEQSFTVSNPKNLHKLIWRGLPGDLPAGWVHSRDYKPRCHERSPELSRSQKGLEDWRTFWSPPAPLQTSLVVNFWSQPAPKTSLEGLVENL